MLSKGGHAVFDMLQCSVHFFGGKGLDKDSIVAMSATMIYWLPLTARGWKRPVIGEDA